MSKKDDSSRSAPAALASGMRKVFEDVSTKRGAERRAAWGVEEKQMSADQFLRPSRHVLVPIDKIEISPKRRPYDATAVASIKKSILEIGLQTPLTCIERNGKHVLVAGRNRLEALRLAGAKEAPVSVVDMSDEDAQLWEISENLDRAELTALQRAEQIARFVRIVEAKRAAGVLAQVVPKPPGRPEGGDREIAREHGLTRRDISQSRNIDSLPDDTKDAAKALGLADNQSALLAAAKESTPEAQAATLKAIAERGRVDPKPDQIAAIEKEIEETIKRGAVLDAVVSDISCGELEDRLGRGPLNSLAGVTAGELAKWIRATTPNLQNTIRVLETAAMILRSGGPRRAPPGLTG
jgi:ParB-like nuclease domain